MNGYHTELDWNTGLTIVVCDCCSARAIAGSGFPVHTGVTNSDNLSFLCSKHPSQMNLTPRPKYRMVRRITSFYVMARVASDGTLVMP